MEQWVKVLQDKYNKNLDIIDAGVDAEVENLSIAKHLGMYNITPIKKQKSKK